uniref:Origin recognition complex subunit 4 n=1 Tax=Sinocyclocheilus rhinocerous TaxID=307959 RepID=A0A673KLV1_9TELE
MSKQRSATLTEAQRVSLAQKLLRERLCHQKLPDRPVGLDSQYKHLLELLRRTAVHGESNSILIVDPRGSGKTMVRSIKRCTPLLMTRVAKRWKISSKFLKYSRNLENFPGIFWNIPGIFGNFAENLAFLLEALKKGDKSSSRPVLFVLDEFDLFAHHKNQTLLYNLLDVSQSAQTPVAVVGLTCRLDVLELLEKRVKSRFSHRQIHLFSSLSFSQYVDVVRAQLSLPPDFPDPKFSDEWNHSATKLCEEKSVEEILKRHFNASKDFCALHSLLFLAVSRVSVSRSTLREADLLEASRLISADSKANVLHGLSILELCLVIAMKHLNDTYDGEPFNFQMVHNGTTSLSAHGKPGRFKKPLCAFEHLLQLELVRPVDSGCHNSFFFFLSRGRNVLPYNVNFIRNYFNNNFQILLLYI